MTFSLIRQRDRETERYRERQSDNSRLYSKYT